MSGVLCAATTSRGHACLNQAKDGPFCPGHDPAQQCGVPVRNGWCGRRAQRIGEPCSIHADRIVR